MLRTVRSITYHEQYQSGPAFKTSTAKKPLQVNDKQILSLVIFCFQTTFVSVFSLYQAVNIYMYIF